MDGVAVHFDKPGEGCECAWIDSALWTAPQRVLCGKRHQRASRAVHFGVSIPAFLGDADNLSRAPVPHPSLYDRGHSRWVGVGVDGWI